MEDDDSDDGFTQGTPPPRPKYIPFSIRDRIIPLSQSDDQSGPSRPPTAPSTPPLGPEPVLRTAVDLDSRFFPHGIRAGSIICIRGKEGTQKSFFITYLLARFLFCYPTQKAALIDTTCHFSVESLISILSFFDPSLRGSPEASEGAIKGYCRRLIQFKCFKADDLLLTLGFPENDRTGPLEATLLENPDLGLVALDALDQFCYCPALESLPHNSKDRCPDLATLLKSAVKSTKTPTITSLNPDNTNAFLPPPAKSSKPSPPINNQLNLPPNSTSTSTTTTSSVLADNPEKSEQNNNPRRILANRSSLFSRKNVEKPMHGLKRENNLCIHLNSFTETLTLTWVTGPDRFYEGLDTTKLILEAHLRSNWSKHSANTALSAGPDGVNHRARFSIFSGMLYVQENVGKSPGVAPGTGVSSKNESTLV